MILGAKMPGEGYEYGVLPDWRKLLNGTILRRDFNSNEELWALLRRTRRMTMVECEDEFYWGGYRSWAWEFYGRVKAMGSVGKEKELELVLR